MSEEQSSPKSSNGIMYVLIFLVVILIGAIGAGGYLLYSNGIFDNGDKIEQTDKNEDKIKESDEKGNFKASLNDLVLNITNAKGREKLMKLSFSVKSNDPNIEALVEEYKAELVDIVIQQISARSSEELLTVGGKVLLKEELLENINETLNSEQSQNEDAIKNSIKKILFTTFVIK